MGSQDQENGNKPIRLDNLANPTHPVSSYSTNPLTQDSAFIGRVSELAAIKDYFKNPNCCLVTLVGPGGVGKTRIAWEVAAQLSHEFAHGSTFISLTAISSPALIVHTLASSIGYLFHGTDPPHIQLITFLRHRELLLVLDNFEHLMSGVDLITEILQAAPGVRFLITSRERLNLREEWILDIQGLAYPFDATDGDVTHYPAVQLFGECARRVKVDFQLTKTNQADVIRICRLVEGMPLGIELAASWVRVLSCRAIGDEIAHTFDFLTTRLRNVPEKHRSMRVVFAHSYDLLTPVEQQVFSKLSMFRGGFQHEAAEAVAGASLVTLSALVDKSLLWASADGRYAMHELLRQYADEQLEAVRVEAEETRDRHCRYYTTFLADCWPRLTGTEIKHALTEIDIELENVRTAWAWALRHQKAAEIELSQNSLWFFYDERARYREGEKIFSEAAAVFSENPITRAKMQARQGALCYLTGLVDKGNSLLRESVMILRRTGARADLAFALHRLAIGLLENNLAFAEAAEYLQESLAIFTELDDRWRMAHVLNWLSIFHHKESAKRSVEGALTRAEQCAWECLSLYQQLDSLWGMAAAYLNLGDVAHLLGEYEKCKQYRQKSLGLFREMGSFWGVSISLILMGEAACEHGLYTEARRYTTEGVQTSFEHQLTGINFYSLYYLALAAQIWLAEGEIERAYEVIGLLDRQRQGSALSERQHGAFAVLTRLEKDLPPRLVAAVERGRAWDTNTAIQEIIADFSQTVEDGVASSPLTTSQPLADTLTERELEVLRLVADGLSNREIAERLVIAVSTVKWHLNEIFSKLDVKSRTQATRRGKELHLLS